MSSSANTSRVKVGVRIRPLINAEIVNGADSVVTADHNNRIRVAVPARQNSFDFDWAYGPTISQKQVYKETCEPLLQNFFDGFNATVFAYGQTGSGKTFTMGNDGNNSKEGIIPYAISDIFDKCNAMQDDGIKTTLELSYMEVYKEECFDLLSSQRTKCDIREGSKGDTYVEGLSHRRVLNPEDVQELLSDVARLRSTAKTAMNSQSSRSHAICTFTLTTTKEVPSDSEGGMGTVVTSKSSLHLVDLAGSERAKKTMATGEIFSEGVNINKGLLALGNVIVALSSQGSGSSHVPYRDSKITRILKDSLGGNSMTVMIACVSPADTNFEETLNTLRFASRASNIVNSTVANKEYSCDNGSLASMQLIQEVCVLREQLRLLEIKAADRNENTAVVDQFLKLTSFTRNVLVKCLEEDVAIDDANVESAREILACIRRHLAAASDNEESSEMELDFLPPLMKLIEELESLEDIALTKFDSGSCHGRYSDCSENSLSSEESDRSSSNARVEGVLQLESGSARDLNADRRANVQSREEEVANMVLMTAQCKATISQLRQEVEMLENERRNAILKIEKQSSKPSDVDAGKAAQVLREKSKLLEAKQKELRKKEVEYARLLQEKDKACREVSLLKKELESTKRQRVEAMKKQRKEAEKHAEERRILLNSETQLRRREQQANEKAAKISAELTNKDRVLKGKLEEKEREIKKLKMQSDKQEKVKLQREQSASRTAANGFRKPLSRNEELKPLNSDEVLKLQNWITSEIDAQIIRNNITEDIQYQTEQRAIVARKLLALKQQREKDMPTIGSHAARSEEDIIRDNEIKQLDEDVRRRGTDIAKSHAQLADMGTVVEKRRFSSITDLKKAKVLLHTMFYKLSHDKVLERRQLESKVQSQEEEIKALHSKLHHYEAQLAASRVQKRCKSASTDLVSASKDITSKPDTVIHKEKRKPGLPDLKKCIIKKKSTDNKKLRENQTEVKDSKKEENIDGNECENSDNEDEELQYLDMTFDDDYDDELDESFEPEEDEEEASDDEAISQRQRKRSSKELDDDASDATSARSKRSKGSIGSDISGISDIQEPSQPLSKYKVPELKKFLSERSLPVSGRKDELIARLQNFLDMSQSENINCVQENDENVLNQNSVQHALASDNSDLKKEPSTGLQKRKLFGATTFGLNFDMNMVQDLE